MPLSLGGLSELAGYRFFKPPLAVKESLKKICITVSQDVLLNERNNVNFQYFFSKGSTKR